MIPISMIFPNDYMSSYDGQLRNRHPQKSHNLLQVSFVAGSPSFQRVWASQWLQFSLDYIFRT